ncbi:hypothetical protein QVD17_13240 [Tagetes erecta]|uniref:F-box domain-containing protein n=1 Tax=Tagetes erecta TaxID=13708 RepID=A0AAD8L0C7_TARER|nr:hypothetical protein QVD17_13240 [Tagetes erecta]
MTSQPPPSPPSSTVQQPEITHINLLPDELLLLIFTKLNNAKSLSICKLISKRFSTVVNQTPSISLSFPHRNLNNPNDNLPKKLFNYLSKSFFKKPPANNFDGALFQSAVNSLKSFQNVRNMRIELPSFQQDESVIKWHAEFGRGSNVCVILFATSLHRQSISSNQQIQNHDSAFTNQVQLLQSTSSIHQIRNPDTSLTNQLLQSSDHQIQNPDTLSTNQLRHDQSTLSNHQIRNPETLLTNQLLQSNHQIQNPDTLSTNQLQHHQSASSNHQIQNPNTSLTNQLLQSTSNHQIRNPDTTLTNHLLQSRLASSNQCFREATWRQHILRHVTENHRHTLQTAEICDSDKKGRVIVNDKQQLNDLLDPEVKLPASGYGKLWHVQVLRLPESRCVLYGGTVVAIRRTEESEEECEDVGVKELMKKCDEEDEVVLWEAVKHILENNAPSRSLNVNAARR